jgi:putative membrane protein
LEVVMMGGYGYGNGWMWIWPLLVLVGLVILGVVAVRMTQGRSSGGPGAPASTARQVLDDRYARGEIDEDEYRKRRSALQ